MIGTRILANTLRQSGMTGKQSSWRNLPRQQLCIHPFSSTSSAMIKSSIKEALESSSEKSSPYLIASRMGKAFKNPNKAESTTKRMSYLNSFLLASVGFLMGISAKKAYQEILDESSSFMVSCAVKEKKACCGQRYCHSSGCLHKLDCEEDMIRNTIHDFERALTDTKNKAADYAEEAMAAYCEAISLICQFVDRGYCVIENDVMDCASYEKSWCCVYDIAKKRCKKVKEAMEKSQCAWELLCRLREVIEAGKVCKYTESHPLIKPAEDFYDCAEKELTALREQMACVGRDYEGAKKYKSDIEKFRQELTPSVNSEVEAIEAQCCEVEFDEQKMAIMIDLAYKKVIRVHKEHAKKLVCAGKIPKRAKRTCC